MGFLFGEIPRCIFTSELNWILCLSRARMKKFMCGVCKSSLCRNKADAVARNLLAIVLGVNILTNVGPISLILTHIAKIVLEQLPRGRSSFSLITRKIKKKKLADARRDLRRERSFLISPVCENDECLDGEKGLILLLIPTMNPAIDCIDSERVPSSRSRVNSSFGSRGSPSKFRHYNPRERRFSHHLLLSLDLFLSSSLPLQPLFHSFLASSFGEALRPTARRSERG